MQDSVSKTTLPVNISVLSSTWQQFECSVDVCHVNGVRGVHSAHTKYAVRGTDSKDEFITTDFTNF